MKMGRANSFKVRVKIVMIEDSGKERQKKGEVE